jgi:molybdenum cofactor cytidylyltransferase
VIQPPSVVAIILAAGRSRRFGESDKLLADYRGRPLITRAAELAAALPFLSVLAVCRPDSGVATLLRGRGIAVHLNPAADEGMASSLAIGIAAAAQFDPGAGLILLGDMPEVTPAHLRNLLEAFDAEGDIVSSAANGRRMPPSLFGHRHFDRLRGLSGDQGARALTQNCRTVEAAPEILRDIDEPGDIFSTTGDGRGP